MANKYDCPICKNNAAKNHTNGYIHYNCARCGSFYITKEASQDYVKELDTELTKTKISGWIRENQNTKISNAEIAWLIKSLAPINVYEKAQKLLSWIAKKTPHPGYSIAIKINSEDESCIELLSVCWAFNEKEIRYLIEYLVREQLLSRGKDDNVNITVTVTPHGFSYLDNVEKNKNSNIGFCAMWFDESMRLAWEKGFEPAIKQAGYEPKRIDEHPHNGVIVDEIISLIRKSKFVVADLTGSRGGVYYEAGFAKGFGIEVIFTCRSDIPITDLHFDVRHYNFLQWDKDNFEELRNNLAFRIEGTLGAGMG